MKHPGYAVDLHSVARHLVTQVTVSEQPLTVAELASSYDPPNPSDLTRVMGIEKIDSEREAKEWMVRYVVQEQMSRALEENGDGVVRWREGKNVANSRYDGKVLALNVQETPVPWRNSFSPIHQAGVFSANIRRESGKESHFDTELRDSMRQLGWIDHHPAIKDEFGVVLVGHRRLQVAEELGIEPKVVTIRLGDGAEADAARFKLAIASNLGGKPFTPQDRKRISEVLYEGHEWSMDRIAEALAVSEKTVSNDLTGIAKRSGTPGRSGMSDPAWQAAADPLILRWMEGEITRNEAVAEGARLGLKPCSNGTFDSRRKALEGVPGSYPSSDSGTDSDGADTATEDENETEPDPPVGMQDPVLLAIRAAKQEYDRLGEDGQERFRRTLLDGARLVIKHNVTLTYITQCFGDLEVEP